MTCRKCVPGQSGSAKKTTQKVTAMIQAKEESGLNEVPRKSDQVLDVFKVMLMGFASKCEA